MPKAVAQLLQLLGSSSQVAQVAAADTLHYLSQGDFVFRRIASVPQAAERLVKLLANSSQDVPRYAADTLRHLPCESLALKRLLLCQQLQCSWRSCLQQQPAGVMGSSSRTKPPSFLHLASKRRVAAVPDAVEQLLASSVEDVQLAAAGTLPNLAYGNLALRQQIAAMPEAVEQL
uniref:Armadillo repeat-containing domain-containing protein n=1 Tax=Tetradesmus obliquus TaxID=3088 RepID=A0A383W5B5_TETOB|eukprot:jgi/Sobl393_1/9024/SZX72420.1